jgi:two-component system chemotaxis response regulator CheY
MTRTLLIADDSLIIRRLIEDAATEAGWQVLAKGTNGQEAFDLYREFHPDAMTLDLVMPGFDGLYALRNILEFDREAKIMVVSALEQKSVLREAFKLGAADFLIKPFDKKVLMATLEKLVPDAAAV